MAFVYTSSTTINVSEDPLIPEIGRFVSVYDGGGIFSTDIQYFEETTQESVKGEIQEIELLSYNQPVSGLNIFQKDVNTITISGIAQNVIQGGSYKFLMPDKTIQILPADTTLQYDALVRWSPPPIKMVQVNHIIEVMIKKTPSSANYNQTLSVTQEIYWRLQYGLQAFQSALAKGRL